MAVNMFRRYAMFLGGSAVAGLAIAWLLALAWPELIRNPVPPAAAVQPPPAGIDRPTIPITTTAITGTTQAAAASELAIASNSDPLLEQATQGSFSGAVRASAPAVVSVYAQRTVTERLPGFDLPQGLGGPPRPRYRERVQRGLGSGVIVDAQGHIVTNQHVIADSDQIRVQLADGRIAEAKVVGRDPGTDLAVLQIKLPRLPIMTLGRSDRVAVGDVVLAIGSPLGLSQTVTHGIVSATGRAQLGVAAFENFIQTDAAINVGNSGGALVDVRGALIGINTAVLGKDLGAEGIGIAIPVDLVRGVMREILQHGRVIRGWIGIVPEDIPEEYVRQLNLPRAGVVISNLYQNSPALRAGMAPGDMIAAIDNQAVRNAQDTLARIASRKPGTTIKVSGTRGRQSFSVEIEVTEPPVQTAQ
jgi:serine protease DegS